MLNHIVSRGIRLWVSFRCPMVNREASFAVFDKIHIIANFESKLFANFSGKRDASVESDHGSRHLEPLHPL